MKILGLFKSAALVVSKHKAAILAGTAIVTGLGTTALAVKATIDSVKDVETLENEKKQKMANVSESEENLENKSDESLTKKEIVKTVWKHYVPVILGTVVTTTCIVCAHRVNAKRLAAVTTALVASEKMRKELETKTISEIGHEKVKEIKKKIFKENPDVAKAYKGGEVEVLNEREAWRSGKYVRHCWFRDEISGREFWSTKSDVEWAITKAMREALMGGAPYITLNQFYGWLDVGENVMGEMLGWDLSRQELNVTYESDMTADGEPCLVLRYYDKPVLI